MKTKLTPVLLITLACALLLAGCGVKPDKLASPDPNDHAPFPATYPRAAE